MVTKSLHFLHELATFLTTTVYEYLIYQISWHAINILHIYYFNTRKLHNIYLSRYLFIQLSKLEQLSLITQELNVASLGWKYPLCHSTLQSSITDTDVHSNLSHVELCECRHWIQRAPTLCSHWSHLASHPTTLPRTPAQGESSRECLGTNKTVPYLAWYTPDS